MHTEYDRCQLRKSQRSAYAWWCDNTALIYYLLLLITKIKGPSESQFRIIIKQRICDHPLLAQGNILLKLLCCWGYPVLCSIITQAMCKKGNRVAGGWWLKTKDMALDFGTSKCQSLARHFIRRAWAITWKSIFKRMCNRFMMNGERRFMFVTTVTIARWSDSTDSRDGESARGSICICLRPCEWSQNARTTFSFLFSAASALIFKVQSYKDDVRKTMCMNEHVLHCTKCLAQQKYCIKES